MARLLDSFPPERIKREVFVSGGAFRKKHEFKSEGEKKRFFFILNRFPKEDDRLIIVTATTQIEKRKQHRPLKVLVEITPREYSPLERNSVIDCESAFVRPRQLLEKEIHDHQIEPLVPLRVSILKRLCEAISHSRTLAPIDKQLVLGEENQVSPADPR